MTHAPSSIPDERVPVIVGVGEIVDRPKEIAEGLEPLALLVEALKRAEQDSGGRWLGEIESLDVVNFLSWRYRDPEKQLAGRLGIQPSHLYYGPVGGESPIRYLHEAAQRIGYPVMLKSTAGGGGIGMKCRKPFNPNTRKIRPSKYRAITDAILISLS